MIVSDGDQTQTTPMPLSYWWPERILTPEQIQSSMDIPMRLCEALHQKVNQHHGLAFGYSWGHDKVRLWFQCFMLLVFVIYNSLCFLFTTLGIRSHQVRDLVDRITMEGDCSSLEMMLGIAVRPETRDYTYIGEPDFVNRIKVFKWRDIFQTMAIQILRMEGTGESALEWEAGKHIPNIPSFNISTFQCRFSTSISLCFGAPASQEISDAL